MKTWRLLLFGCVIALGALLAAPLAAQEPDPVCETVKFFPQTGHSVCDEFLAFFNAQGGVAVLGYPITQEISEYGRRVQYFQRGRLDYAPELSPDPDQPVQLAPLGELMAPAQARARIPESSKPAANDPHRRYFAETGHIVAEGFLTFFEANGAVARFGYPVTEYFSQDGRNVQYFQFALMEWDANGPSIVLHDLGQLWYDRFGKGLQADPALGQNLAPGIRRGETPVTQVRTTASVRNAFTGRSANQTIWVYVNDQNDVPLQGASVTLVAPFLPGSGAQVMPPTDARGHTQADLTVSGLEPGELIVVDAIVEYNGITTRTGAFFYSWW
jgi:hypothetical protein